MRRKKGERKEKRGKGGRKEGDKGRTGAGNKGGVKKLGEKS